ncbi:hypothetical protein B0H12DRAFT_229950 [Mycena haematopus]|nr:hypothetical protein B0H12DRAFT_229950 [Mycena haematopus]
MSSGGKLPIELERLIFEYAAETTSVIPKLVLVAQRVREWLEPLLYRVLNLSSPNLAATVLESLKTKPASFLASTIRHVLVYSSTYSLERTTLESFIESCPAMLSLTIIGNVAGPNLLPALGSIRVQRLSVDVGQLFNDEDEDGEESAVDLEHPLFAAVSHLDILDGFDIEDAEPQGLEWLRHLATLPALTHLSFSSTPPNPFIVQEILQNCPLIRVLVVAFADKDKDGADTYLEHSNISDSRFVVVTSMDYYEDWERGARGEDDVWARAAEFISRKEHGEIKADDYRLDLVT